MSIRQYFKHETGRRTAYWALVESHRTATGPLQRVVAWLDKEIPEGREYVPWDVTSLILIIARLLNPSSEPHIAEQWFAKTALTRMKARCEKQSRNPMPCSLLRFAKDCSRNN